LPAQVRRKVSFGAARAWQRGMVPHDLFRATGYSSDSPAVARIAPATSRPAKSSKAGRHRHRAGRRRSPEVVASGPPTYFARALFRVLVRSLPDATGLEIS
jgi:hypothetical protein